MLPDFSLGFLRVSDLVMALWEWSTLTGYAFNIKVLEKWKPGNSFSLKMALF